MPFKTDSDLPEAVLSVLPTHAQHIYREAFNSAFDEYKDADDRQGNDDRETVAHKVAWSAVKKKKYQKGDDDKWHPID